MKNSLPTFWFVSAGLMVLATIAIPLLVAPGMDDFARTAVLATTLPQGILSGLAAVAYGLVHMLILRARPSTTASVFGFLHLGAALLEKVTQTIAQILRQQIIIGTHDVSNISQTMGWVHMASSLTYLLGLVFFIIAVAVALSTRPPAEEAF